MTEQTLSLIKPDAMKAGHARRINLLLEKAGFKIVKQQIRSISEQEAQEFYAEHKERPFYNSLVEFMSSGDIVIQVLEKDNAVLDYRKLMGHTDPFKADEDTLRKLFGSSIDNNAVHGSDSLDSAKREIDYFFGPNSKLASSKSSNQDAKA